MTSIAMTTEDRNAIVDSMGFHVHYLRNLASEIRSNANKYALSNPNNTKSFEGNYEHYVHHISPLSLHWCSKEQEKIQRLIDIMYS